MPFLPSRTSCKTTPNIIIVLRVKMKSCILPLLALVSTATAHYTFPELVVGGQKTGLWTYVRKAANYQSNGTYLCVTLPKGKLY